MPEVNCEQGRCRFRRAGRFGLALLFFLTVVAGCSSREQRLAEIRAGLAAHAKACFAPGRRVGAIDDCMVGRGFREPRWNTDDARIYSQCEPTPAIGGSHFCVGLYVDFVWPAAPPPGSQQITVEDGTARRWKLVTYDKFAGAPRMH